MGELNSKFFRFFLQKKGIATDEGKSGKMLTVLLFAFVGFTCLAFIIISLVVICLKYRASHDANIYIIRRSNRINSV